MKCPVCQYDNPAGVTHCNLCSEVFNINPARQFLHTLRQEREIERASQRSPGDRLKTFLQEARRLPWEDFREKLRGRYQRHRRWVIGISAGLAVAALALFFASSHVRRTLFGFHLHHRYSGAAAATYLVGLSSEVKTWSEREDRLDTPLPDDVVEETGRLKVISEGKAKTRVHTVQAEEWIKSEGRLAEARSRVVPAAHPSLKTGRASIAADGKRTFAGSGSTRLGRAMMLILPQWPMGRASPGRTWIEETSWNESLAGWTIRWSGPLNWRMEDFVPCASGTCAKMTCDGSFRARLTAPAGWAKNTVTGTTGQASGRGEVLVDAATHWVVSNSFSHRGQVAVTVRDLGRIPDQNRIGRFRVKDPRGVVKIDFSSSANVRIME